MSISICIVDDNQDIRLALEQIILMEKEYTLIGSFSNAPEALEKIPLLKPDIALMDINLGDGGSGIETIRKLKSANPGILFMICTVYEEDEKIFEALQAGANGYILKKTTPARLLEAIRELHEGGAPMSSQIARKVVDAFRSAPPQNPDPNQEGRPIKTLSNRENEILELLAKGLLYKEIASRLYISAETVRKHAYHIYEKLHVQNRIEAINRFYGRQANR